MHRKPTTTSSTTGQVSNHHNRNKKLKPKSLDRRSKSWKYEIMERDEPIWQRGGEREREIAQLNAVWKTIGDRAQSDAVKILPHLGCLYHGVFILGGFIASVHHLRCRWEWSVDEMRGRRREAREKEEKKNEGNRNLSNSNIKGFGNWYDHSQQTSPTKSKYLPLCHWNSVFNFWKHQFAVFSFHHSHSKFLSLSDENNIRKSSQTTKFVWVPRFLITQLWVLSDMI